MRVNPRQLHQPTRRTTMPHYRCIIPKDALSFEQRQQIALAFTDIHCGSTGAPRSFVSVTFIETPEGEDR